MNITRWQAPVAPTESQLKQILELEGLTPVREVLPSGALIPDHRHAFDEVRMIFSGELLINITGNQILLRSGDKIIIPSNTKHSKKVQGQEDCISICAKK